MAANRTSASSRSTVSRRNCVAAAPTGSNTTGIPRALAAFPAASIASTVCRRNVPILISSAEHIAAMSAISDTSSAIIGDAPSASKPLAVKFIATPLVMLCTNGFCLRALSKKRICIITAPLNVLPAV